jgi:hypothetical protein
MDGQGEIDIDKLAAPVATDADLGDQEECESCVI